MSELRPKRGRYKPGPAPTLDTAVPVGRIVAPVLMDGEYPTRQYVYKVSRVERISDGDTYWLHLDVGFRADLLVNLRLLGYDCPESVGRTAYERGAAARAKEVAAGFISAGMVAEGGLWVRTQKDPDSFGRWLGDVWVVRDGAVILLGAVLADAGLASVWPTRWRDAFPQK